MAMAEWLQGLGEEIAQAKRWDQEGKELERQFSARYADQITEVVDDVVELLQTEKSFKNYCVNSYEPKPGRFRTQWVIQYPDRRDDKKLHDVIAFVVSSTIYTENPPELQIDFQAHTDHHSKSIIESIDPEEFSLDWLKANLIKALRTELILPEPENTEEDDEVDAQRPEDLKGALNWAKNLLNSMSQPTAR
jgi:hypothetical protein